MHGACLRGTCSVTVHLAVLRTMFHFVLGPLPSPGEGPDCNFPEAIGGFWADSGRIRGVVCFEFPFWLSAQLGLLPCPPHVRGYKLGYKTGYRALSRVISNVVGS